MNLSKFCKCKYFFLKTQVLYKFMYKVTFIKLHLLSYILSWNGNIRWHCDTCLNIL